jgi:hypothetical protein
VLSLVVGGRPDNMQSVTLNGAPEIVKPRGDSPSASSLNLSMPSSCCLTYRRRRLA